MEVENVNMKKLFPDKRASRKKLLDFLDKKGFYIVLVLCLVIIGTTTFYVTTHNIRTPNIDLNSPKIIPDEVGNANAAGSEDKVAMQSSITALTDAIAKKDEPVKQGEATKPATPDSNKNQATPPKNTKSTSTTAKSTAPKNVQNFIMPVFGDISQAFAKDKLVYSKTLEDWRVHNGIDIAAERGSLVKAVGDGFISEIKSDPRLGIIVIIDHQNGLKTVYANLASDDMVSTNQKVKQGDVIGCVGNTASFESVDQAHIHFEVWKNGENVDPATYLTNN
jgi:murein DD-endopeptidase MepM/ murein hydrolase activator NlpD